MTTLSPEAQAVIDAARGGDDPTAADKARVHAAVLAAIGAGAAASGTAHAATGGGSGGPGTVANASSEMPALTAAVDTSARSTLGIKIAGGLVLVTALVIGGILLLRDDTERNPVALSPAVYNDSDPEATPVLPDAPAAAPATPHISPMLADDGDDGDDGDTDEEITEIAPEVIERRSAQKVEKRAELPADGQPEPEVAESKPAPAGPSELELLGKAKRAENKRDWTTALELAAQLRRDYPGGKLVIERVALEARVLCKSGKLATGQAKATKFLDRWPRAPQAASLRRHCQLDD